MDYVEKCDFALNIIVKFDSFSHNIYIKECPELDRTSNLIRFSYFRYFGTRFQNSVKKKSSLCEQKNLRKDNR